MSGAAADGGPEVMLVASNFPPVRGGSGAVYANLARCAAPRILVVAPRIGYSDGLPLIGWREYDRMAPFPVQRLPLLRTVFAPRRRALRAVRDVHRRRAGDRRRPRTRGVSAGHIRAAYGRATRERRQSDIPAGLVVTTV